MASKPQRFCKKGHDKDVAGRTTDGKCLPCRIEYRSKPHESTKQICIHGHDTFVCGRDKHGNCKTCLLSKYKPHPRQPEQFCPHNHDTFVHGRDAWSQCRECGRIEQRVKRIKNKDIVLRAKDKPCTDCGVKYPPYVMDFDHLDDKKFTIGKYYMGYSIENLLKEIAKCEVVCSNCHRLRTYNRSMGLKL